MGYIDEQLGDPPVTRTPTQLDRVEKKLDQVLEQNALLLALLADDGGEDDQEDVVRSLDGTVLGGARDMSQPL